MSSDNNNSLPLPTLAIYTMFNYFKPAQPTQGASNTPQHQTWTRTPEEYKKVIRKEFEELLIKKVQHVVPGKKVFSKEGIRHLFMLIGRGAAQLENGHEWTAQLLAGDRGKNFAKVLGALEYGAIKELMHDYIQIFLNEKKLTEEEFKQQVVGESNEIATAIFLLGFGRCSKVTEKLKTPVSSFLKIKNVVNSGNLPSTNSFGTPPPAQNTASFNQLGVNNPPLNAFPSSASSQTAATSGSLFGHGATVNGNIFTNTQGGQSHHSNTPLPAADNDGGPPMDIAAMAPQTPAPKVASASGASRPHFSTLKTPNRFTFRDTPRPTYTSRRGNPTETQTPVPTKSEVRDLVTDADRGSVSFEALRLRITDGATRHDIVEPDKADSDELMSARRYYPDAILELSKKRVVENHVEKIFGEKTPTYHLRLRTDLIGWQNHASFIRFQQLVEEEKAKVHNEQNKISVIKKQINESAAYALSVTEQTTENKKFEAEEKKKLLRRKIEELEREIEDVDRRLGEDIEALEYNADYNQNLADECLEALDEMNNEIKLENASRLAMVLALAQNEIDAKDLLLRAVDIKDEDETTNEEDEDSFQKDKAIFFAQLALIEGGDMKALAEQAMKWLY